MYYLLILISLIIYTYIQSKYPVRTYLRLESKKITKPIRLIQISDYHSNGLIDQVDFLKRLKSEDANFVLMTGDIFDKKMAPVRDLFDSLNSLDLPVYAILGNHEGISNKKEDYIKLLEAYGFHFLQDSYQIYESQGQLINIWGLSDGSSCRPKSDGFNLGLIHSPTSAFNGPAGFDLYLAGHTHGGQVRFPFIGAVYVPGQKLFPKYQKGMYNVNGQRIYISSGLGNSRLPLRALNPIEYNIVDLVSSRD